MSERLEIGFRVDGGAQIGRGHLTRCLTLAAALRRRGARVLFITRARQGDTASRVRGAGFRVMELPAATAPSPVRPDGYGAWIGVSEARDADDTISALAGTALDWLVVDHYGIGIEWHTELRPHVGAIMVVDDLANRAHDCDVLLDQNYFGAETATRYDSLAPGESIRLLGPRYALLQPHYAVIRRALPERDSNLRRVLVYFGAGDATNETGKALEALCAEPLAHLAVDVVVGSDHPDRAGVLRQVDGRAGTTLFRDLPTLAGLIARADAGIGAGGATTWERLCLRLPSVVATVAENQVHPTRALAERECLTWVGMAPDTTSDDYLRALVEVMGVVRPDPDMVDGLGTRRVAGVLTGAAAPSRSPGERERRAGSRSPRTGT
jgi:UDP-2,4-diacetamido-2,4,6-trideoxy-beta-L-altropyranose hydrolase